MPRRDKHKPVETRSKKYVPVRLSTNYKGSYGGEVRGFLPAEAASLVKANCARYFDDEARQMAERAGFVAEREAVRESDGEIVARAEERAREIVAEMEVRMEEKMAAIVSANKRGSSAYKKFEESLAAKDEEIAKLRAGAKAGSSG